VQTANTLAKSFVFPVRDPVFRNVHGNIHNHPRQKQSGNYHNIAERWEAGDSVVAGREHDR
jgi:hypothetical protein